MNIPEQFISSSRLIARYMNRNDLMDTLIANIYCLINRIKQFGIK